MNRKVKWAISSQTSWGQVEGSEIRSWSPNHDKVREWMVKTLECGRPYCQYVLYCSNFRGRQMVWFSYIQESAAASRRLPVSLIVVEVCVKGCKYRETPACFWMIRRTSIRSAVEPEARENCFSPTHPSPSQIPRITWQSISGDMS